jgi:hypothetical protein
MQLQSEPVRGSRPGDEGDALHWQVTSLRGIQPVPPPNDIPVDDHVGLIFATRMNIFLGFEHCFSSAYKRLYLLSANNRVLRHVLFAFVIYLNEQDRVLQVALCTSHLRKALPELQSSLTTLNFDSGHALSIPLLAYLAFWWRDWDVAKCHIKGFYKMLLHLRFLVLDRYGVVSVSDKMPPLVMLMWRLAVRLDHSFGFMDPEKDTIPLIKSTPGVNLRYVSNFIDPSVARWTECIVLTDELEDIRNLAVHYNRRATAIRKSNQYTLDEAQRHIQMAETRVISRIEQLEGKVLSAATRENTQISCALVQVPYVSRDPFPSGQFSHYTPLFATLHDRYIEAIIINRATLIHATITSNPHAGPFPTTRLQAALEICCAFSALRDHWSTEHHGRGRLLEALLYAGYTFCSAAYIHGMRPRDEVLMLEFTWIKKCFSEEAGFGHQGATRMSTLLDLCWENPDQTCWELARITFSK